MRPLALIAAYNRHKCIGANNTLPWGMITEDMTRFRSLTTNHVVIMGRNTWMSLPPKQRPLRDRINVIVSKTLPPIDHPKVQVFSTFEAALEYAYQHDQRPFVIGGAQLYAYALPMVTVMYLTEVNNGVMGDAFFPMIDETQWLEHDRINGPLCSFFRLERKTMRETDARPQPHQGDVPH